MISLTGIRLPEPDEYRKKTAEWWDAVIDEARAREAAKKSFHDVDRRREEADRRAAAKAVETVLRAVEKRRDELEKHPELEEMLKVLVKKYKLNYDEVVRIKDACEPERKIDLDEWDED